MNIIIAIWGLSTDEHFATRTYVTKSGDSLSNTVFVGSMTNTLKFKRTAGVFVHGTKSSMTIAPIKLNNYKGRYDYIFDEDWRNTRIKFYVINAKSDYSTKTQIGEFIVDNFESDISDNVILSLTDKMSILDKNTEHDYFPDTVPNTTVRGTPQPIALGELYQIPVTLIDEVTNRYQVHKGAAIASHQSVADRIDPLDMGPPKVDYTIITVAETGGVGYDLSNPPSGTITADIKGIAGTDLINGFLEYLMQDQGGLTTDDIDTASITAIFSHITLITGLYITQPTNIRDIIDHVCYDGLLFYYQKPNGKIAFHWLDRPEIETPSKSISKFKAGIHKYLDTAPGLTDSIAYQKNEHVFTFEEVADIGGVTDYAKDLSTKEYRRNVTASTTKSGGAIYDDSYAHARHGDPVQLNSINALLLGFLDTRWPSKRYFYAFIILVKSDIEAISYEIGDTIEITYPRNGIDGGVNVQILETDYTALSDELKLLCWGL